MNMVSKEAREDAANLAQKVYGRRIADCIRSGEIADHHFLTALAAAEHRGRERGVWEPVGEAPDDGSFLLTDGLRTAVGFRDSGMSSYRFFSPHTQADLHFQPTHFMPLPNPPENTET
jgi:hypothetical protein